MINIIEEKINWKHTPDNPVLKKRSVYNGRRQRGLYTKDETASPTLSLDAFFLTTIIDALEQREKAIADVKGAYLNAELVHKVLMKIVGYEADLFCEIDPSLKEFLTMEEGRKYYMCNWIKHCTDVSSRLYFGTNYIHIPCRTWDP